ncbi:Flowering time control protein FCA [Camellia lanceoleosa]|nr:Flowering time control protein FCA [Camellia lanceoleosa]
MSVFDGGSDLTALLLCCLVSNIVLWRSLLVAQLDAVLPPDRRSETVNVPIGNEVFGFVFKFFGLQIGSADSISLVLDAIEFNLQLYFAWMLLSYNLQLLFFALAHHLGDFGVSYITYGVVANLTVPFMVFQHCLVVAISDRIQNQKMLSQDLPQLTMELNRLENIRSYAGAVEYKLFVGSLNKQATEKEVEEFFSPYGRVEDVYLMRDEMKQSRVEENLHPVPASYIRKNAITITDALYVIIWHT